MVMHSTSVVGAVLLAAFCAAAGPADATVTASATISSVRINLIDLDPNDGVTPGLTFVVFATGVQVEADASDPVSGQVVDSRDGPVGSARSAMASTSLVSASGVVTAGDLFGVGPSPTARASTTGQATGRAFAYILDSAVVLTPQTRMTITATVAGDLSVSLPGEDAFVEAGIDLYSNAGESLAYSYIVPSGQGADSEHFEGPLSASWTNASSAPVNLYAVVEADVYGFGYPPPIPENGTAGLLMTGLIILGWRQRGSRPPHRR
jgi:hypothetical protein